jgi:hypothetical protein
MIQNSRMQDALAGPGPLSGHAGETSQVSCLLNGSTHCLTWSYGFKGASPFRPANLQAPTKIAASLVLSGVSMHMNNVALPPACIAFWYQSTVLVVPRPRELHPGWACRDLGSHSSTERPGCPPNLVHPGMTKTTTPFTTTKSFRGRVRGMETITDSDNPH